MNIVVYTFLAMFLTLASLVNPPAEHRAIKYIFLAGACIMWTIIGSLLPISSFR